jgi:outer membrane protein assembly factor BamB
VTEVEGEVKLPDPERDDPDGWRRRVFRRHGRQLLCAGYSHGPRLWGKDLGSAIGGGVITYSAGGAQKVAVAIGFTNILWPTKVATGKIVILGLPRA